MGLILRIQRNRSFRVRNNANGQEAVLEVRRSVTRPDSYVLVLHDEAQLYNMKLERKPGLNPKREVAK